MYVSIVDDNFHILVVADLIQNETVTTIVHKRKEKMGEDSGLESGHTSMNTSSDTQSDSNSGTDDVLHPQVSTHTPDLVRTSQLGQASRHNSDFGNE